MSKRQGEESPLVQCARALEDAVDSFAGLAGELGRHHPTTASALEKAGWLLLRASECDESIRERVSALSASLTEMRGRQESLAEAVHAAASAIQERAAIYQQLIARYQSLGASATELNASVKPLLGEGRDAETLAAACREMERGARALADGAAALVADASRNEFVDVARLADSLRQQMVDAQKKLARVTGAAYRA